MYFAGFFLVYINNATWKLQGENFGGNCILYHSTPHPVILQYYSFPRFSSSRCLFNCSNRDPLSILSRSRFFWRFEIGSRRRYRSSSPLENQCPSSSSDICGARLIRDFFFFAGGKYSSDASDFWALWSLQSSVCSLSVSDILACLWRFFLLGGFCFFLCFWNMQSEVRCLFQQVKQALHYLPQGRGSHSFTASQSPLGECSEFSAAEAIHTLSSFIHLIPITAGWAKPSTHQVLQDSNLRPLWSRVQCLNHGYMLHSKNGFHLILYYKRFKIRFGYMYISASNSTTCCKHLKISYLCRIIRIIGVVWVFTGVFVDEIGSVWFISVVRIIVIGGVSANKIVKCLNVEILQKQQYPDQ